MSAGRSDRESVSAPFSRGKPYRIDTHHHLFPPQWLADHGQKVMASNPSLPRSLALEWIPQVSLEAMDRFDIATAILSVTTPGAWFGDLHKARKMARYCNEWGARLVGDHSGRFGMFATMTLNDVDGSLRELEYALDVLKLDGIGLMTSCEGKWPGDPDFATIFDELDRRKAVVYFHPSCPSFASDLIPGVPPPIIEFMFDTTRAVCSLLYSGTFSRCPNIRFIFSHGGGAVPYLADRIASLVRRPTGEELAARIPNGVEYELRKIYYDIVSIAGNPPGMNALRGVSAPARLLFGTDFPFDGMEHAVEGLAKCAIPEAELAAINRENALALFPRLAKA